MFSILPRLSRTLAFSAPVFRAPTRRTLLTTAVRFEPATAKAKATRAPRAKAADSGVKKTATKAKPKAKPKTKTTTQAKAKAKAPPKAKAKPKVKKVKTDKPRLTQEDLPPKKPPPPYVIFYSRYLNGLPQPIRGPSAVLQAARTASGIWKEMSEHEKQAFSDEYRSLLPEYEKAREAYWTKVDPAVVRRINKEKAKDGKRRLRSPVSRRVPNPYALFVKENAAEIRAGLDSNSLTPRQMVGATGKEAAQRWKALSEEEKKRYVDEAKAKREAADAS
ncbi:hypothetical protein GLOTRDRAFT_140950 [Gloeophyllum trabeum ATCC 11539]|uniref:HMG box domain-containing protein n=1 Tax=Gloeophyllum trabeum (strain ATCC 11539 / FP-39264 / Madison 617) TaxID=670483 RepID=S7PVL6_GLOTA|nr:uncharacterized protein GLOTRDRAFT_140950 [Gloeophyllum trabeum ATCC 11539]EPQ51543.1 hypothetical protein GLOTRDRAFT_140950 [Gloeophyllum trabeum ATCC 11539]